MYANFLSLTDPVFSKKGHSFNLGMTFSLQEFVAGTKSYLKSCNLFFHCSILSGWPDSNRRPLGPKPSILPTVLHPGKFSNQEIE